MDHHKKLIDIDLNDIAPEFELLSEVTDLVFVIGSLMKLRQEL